MMKFELSRRVETNRRIKVIIMIIIFILFNSLYYIRFYQPSRGFLLQSRKRLVELQEEIVNRNVKLAKESKNKEDKIVLLEEDKLNSFIVKLNKSSFGLKKDFFSLEIGELKENKLIINVKLQSDYNNFLSYLEGLEEFRYLEIKTIDIKGDEISRDSLDIEMKMMVTIAN
jgi:hypothetical protein